MEAELLYIKLMMIFWNPQVYHYYAAGIRGIILNNILSNDCIRLYIANSTTITQFPLVRIISLHFEWTGIALFIFLPFPIYITSSKHRYKSGLEYRPNAKLKQLTKKYEILWKLVSPPP